MWTFSNLKRNSSRRSGWSTVRTRPESTLWDVGVLPAFPFVPAQRAIRSDSLAHRARKPGLLIDEGPTGRPFAVTCHHSESNCRPVGPLTFRCFRFQGRWPWLLELLALWAETKNPAPETRSSSWTGSKVVSVVDVQQFQELSEVWRKLDHHNSSSSMPSCARAAPQLSACATIELYQIHQSHRRPSTRFDQCGRLRYRSCFAE